VPHGAQTNGRSRLVTVTNQPVSPVGGSALEHTKGTGSLCKAGVRGSRWRFAPLARRPGFGVRRAERSADGLRCHGASPATMPPPRTSYGVSQLISDVNERNRISHPFAVWLIAILSAVLWSALAAVCWRRLGLEQPSAKRSAEVYGEEGEQDARGEPLHCGAGMVVCGLRHAR